MGPPEKQHRMFGVARSGSDRKQPVVHGSHNLSGNIEWYTPIQYIDAAREVMGEINTDPASSELAQETIRADAYYTLDTNGLEHPWRGCVWLNPPYSSKIITPFVDRLLGLLETNEVTQAIMLTHNNCDTAWFHKALHRSAALCFTRGRVRFYNQDGKGNSPTHGHAFFYFGKRHRKFAKVFSAFGAIVAKVGE